MAALTREEILSRRTTKAVLAPIPEFGDVYLRVLSLAESKAIGKQAKDKGVDADELLIAACLADENGARLFSDAETNLIGSELDTPNALAISKACMAVNKLNKAEVDEQKKADAVAAKN